MKRILTKVLEFLGLYQYFYWQVRGKKGEVAVLNSGYSVDEFDKATEFHKNIYHKHLIEIVSEDTKICLDFGCGVGRFSKWLSEEFNLKVTGTDISFPLLKKAYRCPQVNYKNLYGTSLPFDDESYDMIFINLVLGGISEKKLLKISEELQRVLKKNGKLFLVENTANLNSSRKWFFRDENFYISLFKSLKIKKVEEYKEFNDTLSVFTGEKI
ncbi:MAG: class I SAM-dependent methyltransferase [Rhodothermaceae bacterium]